MANPPYSAYTESEILNASPERLVQILYDLGLRSIACARECLRQKDIMPRVRHVNKAFDVVTELINGLDFDRGQEIAVNYHRIYEYCQRRLIDANARQSDEILAEVYGLLSELSDAWQMVATRVSAERTNELMSMEILPSEHAMAGSLSCVG